MVVASFAGDSSRFCRAEFSAEQGGGKEAVSDFCALFMRDVTMKVYERKLLYLLIDYSNEACN